jgi:hypothetical protein
MDTHKNAPLTPKGRETMVRAVIGGLSKPTVARRFKDRRQMGQRFRAEGV